MGIQLLIVVLASLWLGSGSDESCVLGQGQMAGSVTEHSAILQARLTSSMVLINHDLPGCSGIARWEISTDPRFDSTRTTGWMQAMPARDYIVKQRIYDLEPNTRYYYRLWFGPDSLDVRVGDRGTFRTLAGAQIARDSRIVVVTGMNADRFYRHPQNAYIGADRDLGFPGLETILRHKPDLFVATGDNVYYDATNQPYGIATDEEGLRRCYHEQFVRSRFHQLLGQVASYWEKDDHDYRYNDCDNTGDQAPLPALGRSMFREQLPVDSVTYGTYRVSQELQIWLVEGRDYRSPNLMPDGPEKTIWGARQREWLQRTLVESDARFKVLISPTPMVGPDDAYKRDNHANVGGFQNERDAFFAFVEEAGLKPNFYIVCGDRHWQYHAIHPTGIEEFSSGALVDANSRAGRLPGDPASTDPEGTIVLPYVMLEASGGFLQVRLESAEVPVLHFEFFDERGALLYHTRKRAI